MKAENFELFIGKRYHVRDGFAKPGEPVWWANCVLVDIDKNIATFQRETGVIQTVDLTIMYNYKATRPDKNIYQFIGQWQK
jgi:hypothetical protein